VRWEHRAPAAAKRVLFVDDNAGGAGMMAAVLSAGHQVMTYGFR